MSSPCIYPNWGKKWENGPKKIIIFHFWKCGKTNLFHLSPCLTLVSSHTGGKSGKTVLSKLVFFTKHFWISNLFLLSPCLTLVSTHTGGKNGEIVLRRLVFFYHSPLKTQPFSHIIMSYPCIYPPWGKSGKKVNLWENVGMPSFFTYHHVFPLYLLNGGK